MIQRVTATPLDASVIVPSHRGAHRLPALLDALSRQDHAGPWEVVVVLDGVLDDSPDGPRVVAGPAPAAGPARPRARAAWSAALNDGFAAARGRVLIRCDDDLTPVAHMVRGTSRPPRARTTSGSPARCATSSPTRRTRAPTARRPPAPARAVVHPAAGARWVDWSAHNSVTGRPESASTTGSTRASWPVRQGALERVHPAPRASEAAAAPAGSTAAPTSHPHHAEGTRAGPRARGAGAARAASQVRSGAGGGRRARRRRPRPPRPTAAIRSTRRSPSGVVATSAKRAFAASVCRLMIVFGCTR